MSLEIELHDSVSRDARELTDLYNTSIKGLAFCYPIEPHEFQTDIHYQWKKRKLFGQLRWEKSVIARANGRGHGFIHYGSVQEVEGQDALGGVVRYLAFNPKKPDVGQQLLRRAEDHLQRSGCLNIRVFDYCFAFHRFGGPGVGVSDGLPHISTLLQKGGYHEDSWSNDDGGTTKLGILMHLDTDKFEDPAPRSEVELKLNWNEGKGGRQNLTVIALRNEEEVGYVRTYSAGDFSSSEEAQVVCYTAPLLVYERDRGRGLGSYLMGCMLREMKKVGYRDSVLFVAETNHRAMRFYSGLGYSPG